MMRPGERMGSLEETLAEYHESHALLAKRIEELSGQMSGCENPGFRAMLADRRQMLQLELREICEQIHQLKAYIDTAILK